jgi:predicted nucleic acid-binding protein
LIRYFDASALVKRYVREEGSDRIAALLSVERPATSRFTLVEIASALARRCRDRDLSSAERDGLILAVREDARRMLIVEFTPRVEERTAALLVRHPLRAADAVQLGSAAVLAERSGATVAFVAFDDVLNRAAQGEGLPLLG